MTTCRDCHWRIKTEMEGKILHFCNNRGLMHDEDLDKDVCQYLLELLNLKVRYNSVLEERIILHARLGLSKVGHDG
jgi:hypothetical protein